MNSSKRNHKQQIAEWQLEKMKRILADRWLETWKVVRDREMEKRILYKFYNQTRKKDIFVEDL